MKHFRLFLMAAALFTCTTTVDAQTLRNSSGNAIGKIESDGTVRDKSGNRAGQITSSGEIRSSSGKLRATAPCATRVEIVWEK